MITVLDKLFATHRRLARRLQMSAAAKTLLLALAMLLPTFAQATDIVVMVGNDKNKYFAFEQWFGRPADGVLGFTGGQDWDTPDPGWQLEQEWLGGTGRPIYWSIPMTPDNGGAQAFREAASGAHDERYRSWARKILDSRLNDNGPIYVRTTWEIGGEWFPWTRAAQEDPEAYRAGWRRFAAAFHSVSPRFKMVWDFNSDRGAIEYLYPGDEAVDVISQDIYWTREFQGNDPVAAFNYHVYGYERGLAWMANFAAEHGKPMAISEWGINGDDASPWLEKFKEWVDAHNVAYVTYWNDEDGSGYDGRLDTNRWPTTGASFKRLFGSSTPNPPPPSGDFYQIKARHSGKCLDVSGGSTGNGAAVIQMDCNSGQSQQWKLEDAGSGYYKLLARHSGKGLEVYSASTNDGAEVVQWDNYNGQHQVWKIESVGGGYYRLVARHSGKALDVSARSTSNGAIAHQWEYFGAQNQQWLLRLVQ